MQRRHFLLIAGILACCFGLTMLGAPDQMIGNMTTSTNEGATRVLQWMGVVLFSIGVINIAARNDPGSLALRAVMLGNIVLHVLGFAIDLYQYRLGFVRASGVAMGAVVHGLLTLGFVYYMQRLSSR